MLLFFFTAGLLECTSSASVRWERKCIPFRRPAFSSQLLVHGDRRHAPHPECARNVRGDARVKRRKLPHDVPFEDRDRSAVAIDDPAAAGGPDPFSRSDNPRQVQRIGRADRNQTISPDTANLA